ncbi:radical SAM/SPASM domain-containing protein [Thalassoglobus sp.]|uniref:radical SAM protein n=1 Tax=Thalassoglobus sp. TaxID=2795869 RepID=UPI003AA8D7FA
MYLRMAKRVLFETDKRLVWKLFWNMGIKGSLSVHKFKKRMKKTGQVFPPFLYISIINSCNLRCTGCWVDVAAKQQTIDVTAMNKLINEAKANGNVFFGIVGGEPFMHPQILEILAAHPDCYFQVFTNGHFITDEVAKELRRLGNVTPLISVEGSEIVSDERRGRKDVLSKTMQGIQNCLNNKVFTGVCTSVCKTNIDDLVTDKWVDRLIEMGVFYTWFHVYRPMGPDASPDLCLTQEQQQRIRKFVVESRVNKPIIFVDAYYDHDGQALCPAATGITHHINPWGGVEPCPIVQFTKDNIHDDKRSLAEKLDSEYIKDFRELARDTTRGCIVLERPDLLKQLIEKHGAEDGTVRHTAMEELEAMQVRPSQYNPELAIPERSWAYRIAKKHFFNDFHAYDGRDHSKASAPSVLVGATSAPPPEPVLVELETTTREE